MEQMDPRIENINDIRLLNLDDMERQMYKQKLMIEIAHFKQREQLYAQKRQELLELELRFRGNQKHHVKVRDLTQNRDETSHIIIEGLADKLNDAKRKYDLQRSANDDLGDKVNEARDTI